MKKLINLSIMSVMLFGALFADTYTESFDTDGNWAGGTMTGYNAKTYTNSVDPAGDVFSSDSSVRETTDTNSGAYAWRVNTGAYYFRYSCSETVSGFSLYMARWDNSPSPSVTIRYSTNSGSSYSDIETITGSWFTGDKVYKQYSYTFSTPISPDVSSDIYIELNKTTGERLLVDDFVLTYTSSALPTISVNPALLEGFTYVYNNGPSTTQTFTVSGTNLTANISVAAPTNYEISLSSGSGYTSPLTLTQSGGSVGTTTIYVRLKAGLSAGDYNDEDITASSTGATDQTVTCSGTVTEPVGPPDNLFFSEYIEGSSNNKALEIYNPHDYSVDLSRYQIFTSANGGTTTYTLDLTGTLASGDVYVITNSGANAEIAAQSDVTSTVTYFNGNDAVVLRCTNPATDLDIIGVVGTDPGTAWAVAGVANATAGHTLVRKPTVTTGNLDWASSAGTSTDDSEWIVYAEDVSSDLGAHTYTPGLEYASAPTFDPIGGTYYALSQNVTISTTTEDATVYYSTTSSNGPWTEYTVPITLTASATVWAYASKSGLTDSPVASATYTLPIEVETIAELRAGTVGSLYYLSGEAILTFQQSTRNQKYIQDDTAAIVIDDYEGNISTVYDLYDGITGIYGTLNVYHELLQFVPEMDPGPATSNDNVVIPEERTLDSLTNDDQAKLIKIINVTVDDTNVNFGTSAENIDVTQGSTTITLRTFPSTDYSGTAIPSVPQNIICLVGQYDQTMQVSPRFLSDFEDWEDPTLPVELASFTATISAQNYITLTWVTQTETGMRGYYIYRDTDNNFAGAQIVSPMIPSANSSQMQTYVFEDTDVFETGTYFYWLQTNDMDGTVAFHGPVSVFYNALGDNPTPEIPLVTELKSVYPNPFNPVVFIPFSLAKDSNVSFKIYNARGQIVKHFELGSKAAGNYRITWDGTDYNGAALSNGVYQIVMTAGSQVYQTKTTLLK